MKINFKNTHKSFKINLKLFEDSLIQKNILFLSTLNNYPIECFITFNFLKIIYFLFAINILCSHLKKNKSLFEFKIMYDYLLVHIFDKVH